MSEFEKNRDSLKKALGQMPSFDPPAGLWDQIQSELATPHAPVEEALHDAVQHLPGYAPPVTVWNKLARQLDTDHQTRQLRVVRRRQVLQWAAAVALLLMAGYGIMREPGPKVKLQYAQETVQQFQAELDWNTDENIFAQLEQELVQVNDPAINKLRFEYEELSSAHEDVTAMLRSYGRDPQLIRQMADIERERSDIYRQIIEAI
ncbi:hypothetical protein [Lewinella cohaerens]|uniref:hypothetical protein n=1 Tax=Lewinella cohaerens TaxID=70995 RepID=UPI00036F5113|nr:hypothetical protein [Lewinella cohaerens]